MPSEQVSALLMLLIVISASLIIYGYAIYVIQLRSQSLNDLIEQEQIQQLQSLSKLFAYTNGTHLIVGLYTGKDPVQLYRIYVNETLRTDCLLLYSNITESITEEKYVVIPSFTSAKIICRVSSDYVQYKITYGGGMVVGEAARIP